MELSATGADQAKALGEALAALGDDRPDAVWCSPYVRAQQTARIALQRAGLELPCAWTSGCATASSACSTG